MDQLFASFWRFEVARIGNQPVQVSQCVLALTIVLVGLWLARRTSRLIVRRVARVPGIKPNAVAVIEKLVFYALVLVVLAVALQTVNIPISAFAVLGGAFAIGLGFGAQNLFNNFISGLILIVEQPIRIGDLIELEGERGYVKDVGARCARIRREDGVDMLVPNSRLLENTVVNWTLSDRRVRTSIGVGVVYGSPVARMKEILTSSVCGHPDVLPEPVVVLLEDFAADALFFRVYFWTEIESEMAERTTESDIRCAIEQRCAEAGITIAFPQRDVHLDSAHPIDVRLIPPKAQ
jgi:small-conductance mechanosensitive channel